MKTIELTIMSALKKIVDQFSRSIDNDIEHTLRIECIRGVAAHLEAEHNKALKNIKAMEMDVKKRSKEIKTVS